MAMLDDVRTRVIREAHVHATRLAACPRPHDFVDLPGRQDGLQWARCRHCLGEVNAVHAEWYRRGVRDAERAALRQKVTS
ncbi:MAG: hypothetical protein KJ066_19575 [Acidobacteria bacterium]|nr:hypothetical protein [Acidobacteriota bacterium]